MVVDACMVSRLIMLFVFRKPITLKSVECYVMRKFEKMVSVSDGDTGLTKWE